jgi:hypothetical protein
MLSSVQWEKITNKYEGLMWKISHQISGDKATSSLKDNFADLQVAALDAIIGYEKQGEGKNGKFDEFCDTRGFDKYIKTVLWNSKNNKGARITKKASILKGVVSTNDNEEVIQIEGDNIGSIENNIFFEEIKVKLDEKQRKILKLIIRDPKLITEKGKINILRLSKKLNLTWKECFEKVNQMGKIIKNEL